MWHIFLTKLKKEAKVIQVRENLYNFATQLGTKKPICRYNKHGLTFKNFNTMEVRISLNKINKLQAVVNFGMVKLGRLTYRAKKYHFALPYQDEIDFDSLTDLYVYIIKEYSATLFNHDPNFYEAKRYDREKRQFVPVGVVYVPKGTEENRDLMEDIWDLLNYDASQPCMKVISSCYRSINGRAAYMKSTDIDNSVVYIPSWSAQGVANRDVYIHKVGVDSGYFIKAQKGSDTWAKGTEEDAMKSVEFIYKHFLQ